MTEDKFYNFSRLPSGLTVLTEEVPSVRSVAIGFWVKVGAKKEPLNLLGISHFIEHLVFKGSKKYSARQISEIFDSLGGEINAFTSKEYTCFYTRLLDEHIPQGLDVLSDMLENPLFKEKDIKSEKKVVFEEIAMYEDSPDEKIHDLFASVLFKGHPLSKNVLGKKETLLSIQREDLFSFYRSYYTPTNTVLVASGHISHNELIENTLPILKEDPSLLCEEEKVEKKVPQIYIEEKDTEQMHLCIGAKVFAAKHPKDLL
jgi:predicted Zn-dependent peptidase